MFKPVVHIGYALKDELDKFGIALTGFVRRIEVPPNRISQIIAAKRSGTGDTARAPVWSGAPVLDEPSGGSTTSPSPSIRQVSMFAGCLQPRPRAEIRTQPSQQLVCVCGSVGGNWCRDDKGKRGAPGTAPNFTSSAFLPAHRASARSDGGPPAQALSLPWAAACTGGSFLQLQKAS